MFRKILLALLGLLVLVIVVCVVFVASRQHLTFNPPFPAVAASTDSSVIARGHYIVRNIANCAQCHGDTTQYAALMAGADVPLSGGFTWDIPPGKIHARNLTSDAETGIGTFTDGAVARALRFMGAAPRAAAATAPLSAPPGPAGPGAGAAAVGA